MGGEAGLLMLALLEIIGDRFLAVCDLLLLLLGDVGTAFSTTCEPMLISTCLDIAISPNHASNSLNHTLISLSN